MPKVAENVQKQTGNVTENSGKVAENHNKVAEKVAENHGKVTEKLREKAAALGETLTANRIKILELMIEDPYISRADLANNVGISETSIYRNIEAMRGKYLRRVGPDKGGFWEIIIWWGYDAKTNIRNENKTIKGLYRKTPCKSTIYKVF